MGACCSAHYHGRKERKRQMMEALAAEAKTNELLSRIPGRMCTNGASSTACVFTQQGRKGTNQDAMVVWENYACRKDTVFCGVFDGHGPYGHLVARRVRDSLPSKLMAVWKTHTRGEQQLCKTGEEDGGLQEDGYEAEVEDAGATTKEESQQGENEYKVELVTCASGDGLVDGSTKEPGMFSKWKDSMLKAFHSMDRDLRQHPTIDCFCSGSTAVTVLKQGEDLVVANVGDSRAILATRTDDDTLEAIQLTVDLKPSLPSEAERIRGCKGRVFALEDEPEVPRVWLPFDDAPGLAMARAFGDFCLKDFGLISVPDITYRRLTPLDHFVVLATDGVWDVLSNQEVVDIVAWAPTRATAARALVETAVRAWRLKYPTSKVDDCAVVCLFLQPPSSPLAPSPSPPPPEALAPPPTASHQQEKEQEEQAEVAEPHANEQAPHEHDDTSDADDIYFERSNTVRTAVRQAQEQEQEPKEEQAQGTAATIPSGRGGDGDDDDGITAAPPASPPPPAKEKGPVERSQSVRSLADCLSADVDEDEWSALEGVVRVNSLLHLPRFLVGDRRAGRAKAARA